MLQQQTTLNCGGQLLDLATPIVMGILNVTPDSFYDGGKYQEGTILLDRVGQMLEEGARIIDVGGMSSRPGAELIEVQEELDRVLPAVSAITDHFPDAIISIDTIRSEVAQQAVHAGASIVNDISAGQIDEDMYATVAQLGVPYILMHMKGQPKTMQREAKYEDPVQEILDFFIQEVGQLRELGVVDIVLDPGFGFGKTITHNYQILKKMHVFNMLDLPVLTGISRKSMIYKTLGTTPDHALNGTTALHMIALQQGTRILRVHDVKEAVETIKLWERLEKS
jgi:dihydropteroate synthase